MTRSARAGKSCIVVFDVGKTNKKLAVYTRHLEPVHTVYQTFEETQRDGIGFEMAPETSAWMFENLREIALGYEVGVVSIAAHGAAFACIDAEGSLAMPVMAYTTDPGEDFHAEFYRKFGSAHELHAELATPNMPGLACMAKGIWFARTRFPGEFSRTVRILGLPQYYGFLLTGKAGAENTYLGSHTYLWDFEDRRYSRLVDEMGIRHLLPDAAGRPWDVLGTVSSEVSRITGIPESAVVTTGIHDSNASLLPYLVKSGGPFVLNSTGTVCVAMRPAESASIAPDEMGQVVFYNHSAMGDPVRTAIFLGGLEFDVYTGLLAARHGEKAFPGLDAELARRVLGDRSEFILPSIVPFGIFPGSQARVIERGVTRTFGQVMGGDAPSFFGDFERACCVLNLSLAIQSRAAMEKAGMREGDLVYVEGGFRKNEMYTGLLASMLPGSSVMLSDMEEATSFGAALLGKAALEGKSPLELAGDFEIQLRKVPGRTLAGLEGYFDEFMKHVNGR